MNGCVFDKDDMMWERCFGAIYVYASMTWLSYVFVIILRHAFLQDFFSLTNYTNITLGTNLLINHIIV